MKLRRLSSPVVLCAILISTCWPAGANGQRQTVIALDPETTYQTISGWVAVAEIGQVDAADRFHLWQETVLDLAANDLGINTLKVGVRSGFENSVDYFSQYISGQITRDEWKNHWFEVINDNDDPFAIDPSGFQFSLLDYVVDTVVSPLKTHLEARGEELAVYIVYAGNNTTQHADFPEEYAEFVLATYQHLESKYGWLPDGWIVHNEPKDVWTVTKLGNALVAAGSRLEAHGYAPVMIAPEYVNISGAIRWFDQLIAMPGVPQYLKVFSYHRYGGDTDANLQAIGNRAVQYGVDTAMLEKYDGGGTYLALHRDLTLARVSAWEQFALAYPTSDNGAQYYWIDESDPANPTVHLGSRTKFLRQYFRFVRSGAVRIGASSEGGSFDPLAFINSDGTFVVVVKANTNGSFALRGLPAGTYGIKYTTAGEYDVDLPDEIIGPQQDLTASIPNAGVITVYAKGTSTPVPPADVVITGPAAGFAGVAYTLTSRVAPRTSTLPITHVWQTTAQPAVTNTNGLTDTVSFTWYWTGTQAITVTATNVAGTVSSSRFITIRPGYAIYLPLIIRSAAGTGGEIPHFFARFCR